MSFLGSVGHVMAGSGIEECLQQVYGRETIVHVLSGNAYARSLTGHFLIQSALVCKLLSFIPPVENMQIHTSADPVSGEAMVQIQALTEHILNNKFSADDSNVLQCTALQEVERRLQCLKHTLCIESRTAKLWIQYVDYIMVVKQFLLAERTGNWHLHLKYIGNILNLFAATGDITITPSQHACTYSLCLSCLTPIHGCTRRTLSMDCILSDDHRGTGVMFICTC